MTEEEAWFHEDVRTRRHAGAAISPDEERRWAHLNWRLDFADPSLIPDFDREPLVAFPPNYAVNRALNDEMDAWDATSDIHAELATIETPALFVHGAGDPRPGADSMAADLPRARMVTIEGAGHLPWMERPEKVADAMRGFILDVG
jgi:proline iminopeptidase